MATAALSRRTRSPGGLSGMAMAWCSSTAYPVPRPSSRRPSNRRSTVAAWRASSTGLWSSLLSTSVPTRSVVVTSAALTSGVKGRGLQVVGRLQGGEAEVLGLAGQVVPGGPGPGRAGPAGRSGRVAARSPLHARSCICHDPHCRPAANSSQQEGAQHAHPRRVHRRRYSVGGRRRGGRRHCLAAARQVAGRSTRSGSRWRASWRPSSSRCRCSTSRWPAARAATCSAACWRRCWSGRTSGRCASGRAGRAGAAVRGRRADAPSGLNVVNMALVTAFGGYAVFLAARAAPPEATPAASWPRASPPASSVVLASLAFSVEYAIGGDRSAPRRRPCGRHGRRARPHRHRRRRDHRR